MESQTVTHMQAVVEVVGGAVYLTDIRKIGLRVETLESAIALIPTLSTSDGETHKVERIWVLKDDNADGRLVGLTHMYLGGVMTTLKRAPDGRTNGE